MKFLNLSVFSSLCLLLLFSTTAQAKQPNVLFIAVDDLRMELGCYGHKVVKSPNIDKLAAEGTLFERSYCMVAVCGASRASLMTGLRPKYDRFRGYDCYASKDAPNILPMNTCFKKAGYTTISNGKIYHHIHDNAAGWSERPWRAWMGKKGKNYALPESTAKASTTKTGRMIKGTAWECADVDDGLYIDGQTAEKSITDLRRLAKEDQPFFLGVGFVKPHLPFCAPKKYWDLYDAKDIKLPENFRYAPKNAPSMSIHSFGELRGYSNIPKGKEPISDATAKKLIHGYYACVSYTDALVGKLLAELKKLGLEEDTIIVLWGDHGWNLGEHTLWCKHCVYENSMQAPLLIVAPKKVLPEAKRANRVAAPTEFLDIYPTLCALTGVKPPKHLEGESLIPLLKNPNAKCKGYAIGRYGGADTIKTDRFRYSEYRNKAGKVLATMLYDHEKDPRENVNVAASPEHKKVVADLAKLLHGED